MKNLIGLVILIACVVLSVSCGNSSDPLIRAAEQGDAEAQYNLGEAYTKGEGIPQDYAEAVKWTRKAAEQDYPRAQYNLGEAYEIGWGVPQDYISAYMWFNIAASNGNKSAAVELENLAEDMTSNDIEEAKKRAQIYIEADT